MKALYKFADQHDLKVKKRYYLSHGKHFTGWDLLYPDDRILISFEPGWDRHGKYWLIRHAPLNSGPNYHDVGIGRIVAKGNTLHHIHVTRITLKNLEALIPYIERSDWSHVRRSIQIA